MLRDTIKKSIVEFIKEQSKEENKLTTLSSILNCKTIDGTNNQIIEELISLILLNEISCVSKKRNKEELFFAIAESIYEVENENKYNSLDSLFAIVELYSRYYDDQNYISFHKLTNNCFIELPIICFLEKCSAKFTELKVLCRYLSTFFADEGVITIMDLGLNRDQIVDLLDSIYKGNFTLQNQGLIEINHERGGLYLNIPLSARLIDLIKGENITPVANNMKKSKGMHLELKYEHIKECSLYYNDEENELFKMITALVSSPQKDGNTNVSILLYGEPGTGKTEFAYQLARIAKANIMQLNFPEITSKWIGQTEKNIRLVFEQYKKKKEQSNCPTILLINEADGLMNKRVSVNISNDAFHNQAQTQLLELLEDFEGIVIATTNLYKNIDKAFYRRFLFHKEISMPNLSTRELILSKSVISEYISKDLFEKIINVEWSPAQIKNIEQKIKQLSCLQNINNETIENIVNQDITLSKTPNIGFKSKNNHALLSQMEQAGAYISKI